MRCVGHVARIREICTKTFGRKTRRKKLLGSLDTDMKIILKWILRKWYDVDWSHLA
jgi:hypothetical protein